MTPRAVARTMKLVPHRSLHALSLAFAAATLQDFASAQEAFFRGTGQLLLPVLRGPEDADDDMADLTAPEYLWAFQREALSSPSSCAPLPPEVTAQVVAALEAAGAVPDDVLRWQSLWAMARIGRTDAAVAEQVRGRVLRSGLCAVDGPLGDVACVALGLVARDDGKAIAALAEIATKPNVAPERRAYAFYGLGLAAQDSASKVVQFRVLAAVERALLRAEASPDEVRIAALHALALVRLDVAPDLPGPAQVLLERGWAEDAPLERRALDFRAHVPVAVAAVIGRDTAEATVWRERFAAAAEQARGATPIARSAVLALGALCRPWQDDDSPDAGYGRAIQRLAKDSRDMQLRNFAWFAAGLQGGQQQRTFLMDGLGGSFLVKPWAAFGLVAASRNADAPDAEIVSALEAGAAHRNPTVRQAVTDALGVARRSGVDDPVLRFLERYRTPLPGAGGAAERAVELARLLSDPSKPIVQRRTIAAALGHLGDVSPRHWSARLAQAIDYRSATRPLLGRPHGVLLLP